MIFILFLVIVITKVYLWFIFMYTDKFTDYSKYIVNKNIYLIGKFTVKILRSSRWYLFIYNY